jgi:hypothetical protein
VRRDLELSDDAWSVVDDLQSRADRLRRQVVRDHDDKWSVNVGVEWGGERLVVVGRC